MHRSNSGMTLIEVLMATFILGICIVGLMQGLGACVEVFNAEARRNTRWSSRPTLRRTWWSAPMAT